MIAAVYARKSTDQSGVADEQRSVARQIEGARAFAAAHGWVVAEEHVYCDDGVSGAEFSSRPGFVRLMAALKPRPRFQIVIMSEESRLGREQIETAYALKQLVQAGVEVWFYLSGVQRTLDTPTDKIMSALTGFADELERERARVRTKDALTRKARNGHHCGGDCFGYRSVEVIGGDGSRSHVERRVHEPEALVVRRIFTLAGEGYGVTRIAKLLNNERAPAPRPKGRPTAWAPSTVRSVLYRESYRGVVVWNRSQKRDQWGQQKRSKRAASEWVTVERPELRIVTDEQWKAVHARLASTRETYLRQTDGKVWGRPANGVASKYLLAGMSTCGLCGHTMEARSRSHGGERRMFYGCSGYWRRGLAVCANRQEIPMSAADAAVIDALLGALLTPERLSEVVRRAMALAAAERAASPDARGAVEQQLGEIETALQRLTAAVAAGGDVPSLVAAIKAAEGQRQTLERRLAALAAPVVIFDATLEGRLRKAAGEWRDVLGRQVPLARQIVAKLLDGRVTFSPASQDGREGFQFRATGSVEKLIAGAVPGNLLSAAYLPAGIPCSQPGIPPTGFEPVLPP